MISDIRRSAFFRQILGQDANDLYNALNTINGQAYWDPTGREIYGHPGQIFVGIELAY
jgi:hypothetical protein